MSIKNGYKVEVLMPHADWGQYRNPTNRDFIEGESYVKIPAEQARYFNIKRGNHYIAHFDTDAEPLEIKASGNGPVYNGEQLAKQFEGVGEGACKAFTPWYIERNIKPGDTISVEFLNESEILFKKL